MHFYWRSHRADKKTRGRETANKNIHETWKIVSRIVLPQYEHTTTAQKWKFVDETTLLAKRIRFRLKCTMFSQKFPVHSCLEEVFLKQYTQCFYKKHSVRCIIDYMTLTLEEKIRSLTNKAAHSFLLQYLQRNLIIPKLVYYSFDPHYFLLYHFNIFCTLFMQVNWIMKKTLEDCQCVNGWHCCAKFRLLQHMLYYTREHLTFTPLWKLNIKACILM